MRTKRWLFGTVTLVATSCGAAYAADCLGNGYTQLSQIQVQTLLANNTACYPSAAPYANQEYIQGSTLWDYKKGPADPRDPARSIGLVTYNGDGSVTYNYGSGNIYSYTIWGPSTSGASGVYDFCTGASSGLVVRVVSGQSGCG